MKAKLLAIWGLVKTQLADIWNRSKMFLIAALAIILAIEWEKLKAFLLVYMGQKEINSSKKEDTVLAAKESDDNTKADALVKEAQELPNQEKPITVDWYKSKK